MEDLTITLEQAKAGIPATADQVRVLIDKLKVECRSKAARIRMAQMAIKHARVTDEGRDVWAAYLAEEQAAPAGRKPRR